MKEINPGIGDPGTQVINSDMQKQMRCASLTIQVFSSKPSFCMCTEFVDS